MLSLEIRIILIFICVVIGIVKLFDYYGYKKFGIRMKDLHVEPESFVLPEEYIYTQKNDYHRIELLPQELHEVVNDNLRKIRIAKRVNFDRYGMTNLSFDQNTDYDLMELSIGFEEIYTILEELDVNSCGAVVTGEEPGTCYLENTIGFGESNKAVFLEHWNSKVFGIWMTESVSAEDEKLVQALHKIGMHWDLFLVDWNIAVTIQLRNLEEVKTYVNRNSWLENFDSDS